MNEQTLRTVTLRRTAGGQFVAANVRGGELTIGREKDDFTPVELLLVALAGCTALDVDALTSRRAEPEAFEVTASADKIRDDEGNRLENIEVVFRAKFPEDAAGDAARSVLPDMVARSHDRLCTVSRTIERSTPVNTHLD